MKNFFVSLFLCISFSVVSAQNLKFDPSAFTEKQLTMPDGFLVKYKAYENIYYVSNVEDSNYQYLNIYVPENLTESSPVFLRTYIGAYMASKAKPPSPSDASGRALEEGYVVCIPSSRGSNSFVNNELQQKGKKRKKKFPPIFETVYTGKIPAGLLDLKAVVRYLKANDALIPGDSKKIISDGTSAGGAMSALLGATGNHPDYEQELEKMGAEKASDDIFAVVSYCPITDLEHADMAYEWLYGFCNNSLRCLDENQIKLSDSLSKMYPSYLNSLNLKNPVTDEKITATNYLNYLKMWLMASANKALSEEKEISDTLGAVFYEEYKESGCLVDIDMKKYLEHVVKTQQLKTPPAFDSQNILTNRPSAENKAFGLSDGTTLNFTPFTVGHALMPELEKRVKMINPMNYISDNQAVKAKYWYIRHGTLDRDTGFQISLNLALKLMNSGFQVNYFLLWGYNHTGDYELNDLFDWLEKL